MQREKLYFTFAVQNNKTNKQSNNLKFSIMENLNKITSYLMGVCENNNISYTHKVLANCFNCFYVDYNSVSFGVIQMVNDLSKVNNYHLKIEVNKDYTELDGKIEVKKTMLFAYFE